MTIGAQPGGPMPDPWTGQDRYKWMFRLPRVAWGWELLRRDPDYQTAYRASLSRGNTRTSQSYTEPTHWSLLRFENPDHDARTANVLWRRDHCREVLPLIASREHCQYDAGQFSIDHLQCRITVYCEEDGNRCHILFAQDGRFLQLEICGADCVQDGVLMTPVLPNPRHRTARLSAVHRLTDLMAKGILRPALYPPLKRARRLVEVIQVLDAALAGAVPRDIALGIYGSARFRREWHYPNNGLRQHVMTALDYGKTLMQGGYRRFLS
ncbi:MAG: DUF2285 domain-containing protein [Alphaproteobacteria bacterium]|nr:DUF2285 domain-containing protein [Alphaproteobacteria bacterium]MDE2112907.1 DUF2285 domain-containing protein [Alphaproteobacteria bacterium]MDE2493776.1 DUF2285 domain-containing protein [Alphaproteobacteria bacterium]